MEPKQIVKQMIAFNKSVFDNNFATIRTMHEQTERLTNKFFDNLPVFPEESKKAISEWIKAFPKSYDVFKNSVDENFKKMEVFFNEQK